MPGPGSRLVSRRHLLVETVPAVPVTPPVVAFRTGASAVVQHDPNVLGVESEGCQRADECGFLLWIEEDRKTTSTVPQGARQRAKEAGAPDEEQADSDVGRPAG